MVKSGGFITGVAAALELPEAIVAGSFRVLRESGLMTSGARGVNAPDMTDLDAARILIAMLVSSRPAYSESCARDFGQLVCTDFLPATVDPGADWTEENRKALRRMSESFHLFARGLPSRHPFEQGVAELIRMYGDDREEDYWKQSQLELEGRGVFDPSATIEVIPGELEAKITMQGNVHIYTDRLVDPLSWGDGDTPEEIAADLDAEEAHELKRARYSTAIRNVRSVNCTQIAALARLIRRGGE